MKVQITDIITSFKLLKEADENQHQIYMGVDLKNNGLKYGWAYRVHHHTKEELEYGHKQNPQLVTIPFEEVCQSVGIELNEEDKGKTLVAFPKKNSITLFLNYCPAHEFLPDGVDGNLVEVEIDS